MGFLNKLFNRPKYFVRSEIDIPLEYDYHPSGKHDISHLDPVDRINLSVVHDMVAFFHAENFFDNHGRINVWTDYKVCDGLKIQLFNEPFGEIRDGIFHRRVFVNRIWINGDSWDSFNDSSLKTAIERFNDHITAEYNAYKEKIKKKEAEELAIDIQKQAATILDGL